MCQACVEKIKKEVGPVDILINNAGITRDMTFRRMSKVDWDAVMDTNLDSVFNMAKPVCDGMVERGWGASSTSAQSTARRGVRPDELLSGEVRDARIHEGARA